MLALLSVLGVSAQTPEPPAPIERSFSFSFDSNSGYLGMQIADVTKENYGRFGLREVRGVAVEKVVENSPAAAAGLRDGDVIVRFNGDEITSARKLTRLVSEVAPDHQVRITVLRGGTEQELTATVGKAPIPKFDAGNFTFTPGGKLDLKDLFKDLPQMKDLPQGDMPRVFEFPEGKFDSFVWRSGNSRQIGVGVYPMTRQLSDRHGVDSGALVNDVRADSPAERAGLKAGDIILEVNGKPVKGDLDIMRAVNEKNEGDVTLTILRDRSRQTVNVTPEAAKDGGFFFRQEGDGPIIMRPGKPGAPPASPSMIRPPAGPDVLRSLVEKRRTV